MKLEAIVEEYRDRIYRMIQLYAFNDEERQEMYQQVLINLWKSLSNFEGRSSLNTWIYRVCLNSCKMYRRTKFYEKKHVSYDHEDAVDGFQESKLIKDEDIMMLYRCLSRLTDENRIIMSLYLEEISYEEIADIVGISVNLVGVRISRCKGKLKECLKENGIEHG